MGIFAHRLYFKPGLPKVRSIKEKFKEITGLNLGFMVDLHLNELTNDNREIADKLNQSLDKLDYILSSEFKGNKSEAQTGLAALGRPYFYCFPFDEIELDEFPEETSFYLECGGSVENFYFFKALIKTMLELGGKTYTYRSNSFDPGHIIEDYLEEYNSSDKEWKNIKYWDKMSDNEKSHFNNDFG